MSTDILTFDRTASVRNLAALDAAFSSRGMAGFYRGIADARRFSSIEQFGADWFATPADGSARIIVEPIDADYLEGLRAGGCHVEDQAQPHLPRIAA